MIPFLLGIGLRTLSIDIGSAPLIERAIAAIDIAAAEEMATCLLKMGKISDIEAFLIDR
jgi:phosphoenolpyruvate-protein kinase (PTS system EI component)